MNCFLSLQNQRRDAVVSDSLLVRATCVKHIVSACLTAVFFQVIVNLEKKRFYSQRARRAFFHTGTHSEVCQGPQAAAHVQR